MKTAKHIIIVIFLLSIFSGGFKQLAQQAQIPVSQGIASLSDTGIVVANGHGWHGTTLDGVMPAPGTCHVVRQNGQVLPDRKCTPGSIDSAVTQSTLETTICRAGGYTASVRPPSSITAKAKRGSMLAYGFTNPRLYEYDHLISLSLGGSSNVANLWPEQNIGGSGGFIQNAKDRVEMKLHNKVCAHQITLKAAQEADATNWTTAEQKLGI